MIVPIMMSASVYAISRTKVNISGHSVLTFDSRIAELVAERPCKTLYGNAVAPSLGSEEITRSMTTAIRVLVTHILHSNG